MQQESAILCAGNEVLIWNSSNLIIYNSRLVIQSAKKYFEKKYCCKKLTYSAT